MGSDKTTLVYADWEGLDGPQYVGELHTSLSRGKEVHWFEYSMDWLRHTDRIPIDPRLDLFSGKQYPASESTQFGVFLDSSPDRWGRTIMDRRSAARANKSGNTALPLMQIDYLLGVHDASRVGGLRFKSSSDGNFLDDADEDAAPPFARLRELEQASLQFESDDFDESDLERLSDLLAPGSSLGGARPKASVVDEEGNLWVAKFPSLNDTYDVAAWEYLAIGMARDCGIMVPDVRLEQFSRKHHTLLSRRFDRTPAQDRLHVMSAMTMLEREEGNVGNAGYLDMAETIERYSNEVMEQLSQLWRRLAFNVLISNTDDHLRNHSFMLKGTSWNLSPAYDLNPNARGSHLSININETDSTLNVHLVLEVAPLFRIDNDSAQQILTNMVAIVSTWEQRAGSLGLGRDECQNMRRAFEVHLRSTLSPRQ